MAVAFYTIKSSYDKEQIDRVVSEFNRKIQGKNVQLFYNGLRIPEFVHYLKAGFSTA